MKRISRLRRKWQGLADTVNRFPLTIILLIAAAASNTIGIESDDNLVYTHLLITFLVGAAAFVVLQMLYERFFENPLLRLVFAVISVAGSVLYYLCIRNFRWNTEISVRTIVLFFALLIAFLWIPVIRSRYNFNESFLVVFKGFFTTLLYDGVLYLGIVLIVSTINLLIRRLDDQILLHALNIIVLIVAPVYLLTLLPVYPGKRELLLDKAATSKPEEAEQTTGGQSVTYIRKMITPNKLLISLIAYVVIPITAAFTVILLLYIVINIRGTFWTDNLMEPLLVSYSITVIVVYLLASTIQHSFAKYFRRIFPKVLIPLVLFQTVSSILKISESGITYGRYYVILFGVFAVIAGICFCILPVHKNGVIAPILMGMALLSILPPVDAFTVSRTNQINRLEAVLMKNNMLTEDIITPKSDISEEDKEKIIKAVDYIIRMGYDKDLPYLSSYAGPFEFERTFGFAQYSGEDGEYQSFYASRNTAEPIPISEFDKMMQLNIYYAAPDIVSDPFEKNGTFYVIRYTHRTGAGQLILENVDGKELLSFDTDEIWKRFQEVSEKLSLPTKDMTFTKENEEAVITLVANSVSGSKGKDGSDLAADLFVFIRIK
jgi:hypothetical protein